MSKKKQLPSAIQLMSVFVGLGSILAFTLGPRPKDVLNSEHLPQQPPALFQVMPSLCVIAVFLLTYNIYDSMGCGLAKMKHGFPEMPYDKILEWKKPEEVFLAERVQQNQLEQLPGFIVSTLAFSAMVNGPVGALLGLAWATLRRQYAAVYRASAGKPQAEKGLGKYTVPCYFIINSMMMAATVQAVRCYCYYYMVEV
mmetsp:Transcript_12514/g.34738  ORF Transcript_12514/g.34738 Transcript_12514/m.34738 type:complete len:198 (+) Transcript_12514:75-668(+)